MKLGELSVTGVAALALALAGLIGIIGIAALAWNKDQVPDALVALTTAAIGAIGGLLSPSPGQSDGGAGKSAAPNPSIYIAFMLVLGAIAFTGLVGLIWLTKVSADIQLDLLKATSSVSSSTVAGASPSGHALSASSFAGTNTFQIPGGIVAISSAAVGAISALFVPSPASK